MSIDYYNDNAELFWQSTIHVDMEELYKPFLVNIKDGGLILDAGCGTGRDSKAFIGKGYKVEAFDASKEMVKLARQYAGIDVELKTFEEFNVVDRYDGIWSCASLLHVAEADLTNIMKAFSRSLVIGGIWYVSFKYGSTTREKDGRTFTDMNEVKLTTLINQIENLQLENLWVTGDKREERQERWVNALLVRI